MAVTVVTLAMVVVVAVAVQQQRTKWWVPAIRKEEAFGLGGSLMGGVGGGGEA